VIGTAAVLTGALLPATALVVGNNRALQVLGQVVVGGGLALLARQLGANRAAAGIASGMVLDVAWTLVSQLNAAEAAQQSTAAQRAAAAQWLAANGGQGG
jgi:hypothetical protein